MLFAEKPFIAALLIWALNALSPFASNLSATLIDDFESYSLGNIDGQGAWVDFGGTLFTEVSNDRAHSGTQSLKQSFNPSDVDGYGSDVYLDLPVQLNSGNWNFSAWIYVPADMDGAAIGFLSESAISSGFDLGAYLAADGASGFDEFLYSLDGVNTITSLPLARDRWTQIVANIDLDNNSIELRYDNNTVFSGTWDTDDIDGAKLGGVNLWMQGGGAVMSSVYYDDFSVSPVPEPHGLLMATCGLFWLLSHGRRRAPGQPRRVR